MSTSTSTEERYVVTRTIAASPARVFAVLANPMRHKDTEPSEWVRDAIDTDPITTIGQTFAINMFADEAGGHYVMHNLVTDFEPDRTVGWLPGRLDANGAHSPGGWWWRYDLASHGGDAEATDVTLTYDWNGTNQWFRDNVGVPVFGPDFIVASLAALERAVTDPLDG